MNLTRFNNWLENVDVPQLKKELMEIKNNNVEITNRFYKDIEFGTAGLRGILGAGTNYMNIYVVRRATLGIAKYMLENKLDKVAVSYDSRKMSNEFAKEVASVLAYHGIHTYITTEVAPTPLLSYMVRYFKCNIGVMITASHNPAQYNGYKVYGDDGCQITEVMAEKIKNNIIEESFFGISSLPYEMALENKLVHEVDEQVYESFLQQVYKHRYLTEKITDLKVVYSPLNGAGYRLVPLALKNIGVEPILVEEQQTPDGSFTTCPFPNPEVKSALALGIKKCQEHDADILIATDPDCDRVGVAVKHNKDYLLINGNEMGVLLLDYILMQRKKAHNLPSKGIVVKTIVTTKLIEQFAKDYDIEVINTLTGFKYIGEQLKILENKGQVDRYIFGFEESYGYLAGSYVRDKEAVNASLLIAELAYTCKKENITLIDRLNNIYSRYGCFKHRMVDYYFEGASGNKKMNDIMSMIRKNNYRQLGEFKVASVVDYNLGISNLPISNVIEFNLENNNQIIIRPSGTEPKVKVYLTAVGNIEEVQIILNSLEKLIDDLFKDKK